MQMDVRCSGAPGRDAARVAMTFDAAFLTRLKQRDPAACTLLVSSLTPVLEARLRYKLRDYGSIEDIRNETFCRLFCLVDGGRVREPAQFGLFARGVCDRVAQETRRKTHSTEPLPAGGLEPPDLRPHLDTLLVDRERKALLRRELMKLSEADRRLIVELHWEERDRCEMARDRGISITGLNVRLCRAMKRLRRQILQHETAVCGARGVVRTHTRRTPAAPPTRNDACWATMAA
jgi:RNA polymerase sigma-70 factor, ECF subfamily